MRRTTRPRATAWGLAAAALALVSAACGGTPSPDAAPSTLELSSLDRVSRAEPPPAAKFDRSMYATAKLTQSILLLDLCRGPIAIDLGGDRPVLVAEHDYCGGSDWISRLGTGDAVKLSGKGIEAGTYVVTGLETEKRGEAQVSDLPAADVVLQTCISPGELVLVAANKFEPALTS